MIPIKVKMLSLLFSLLLLTGFSSAENPFFDENGNTTEEHAYEMQKAWCEYNEGKYFVTDQCGFLDE